MIRIYNHLEDTEVFLEFLQKLKEVKTDLEDVEVQEKVITDLEKDDKIIFLFKAPNEFSLFKPQTFLYNDDNTFKGLALFYNETYVLGDYDLLLRKLINGEPYEKVKASKVLLLESLNPMRPDIDDTFQEILKENNIPYAFSKDEIDSPYIAVTYVDQFTLMDYNQDNVGKEVLKDLDENNLILLFVFSDVDIEDLVEKKELMDYIEDIDSYISRKIKNKEEIVFSNIEAPEAFNALIERLRQG